MVPKPVFSLEQDEKMVGTILTYSPVTEGKKWTVTGGTTHWALGRAAHLTSTPTQLQSHFMGNQGSESGGNMPNTAQLEGSKSRL